MLFKIKCLKGKKRGFLIGEIITLILFVPLFFIANAHEESNIVIPFIFCFWLFCALIFLLAAFNQCQWYEIYQNKIIVKNIYGVVNIVYFDKVKKVIQLELPIFLQIDHIDAYVFVDNRPIKKFFIGYNIDNHKKTCVRVPITQELQNLIETKKLILEQTNVNEIDFLKN